MDRPHLGGLGVRLHPEGLEDLLHRLGLGVRLHPVDLEDLLRQLGLGVRPHLVDLGDRLRPEVLEDPLHRLDLVGRPHLVDLGDLLRQLGLGVRARLEGLLHQLGLAGRWGLALLEVRLLPGVLEDRSAPPLPGVLAVLGRPEGLEDPEDREDNSGKSHSRTVGYYRKSRIRQNGNYILS